MRKAAPAGKKGYVSSLDGLRALAVLFVLAYHMKVPFVSGGLSGVTVFFVLSGFLITSLLLVEFSNKKTIDLPHFWLRRVKRLFPAIVLVIFTSAAVFTVFNHELLTKMRPDILSSLLFFNNWHQIFQNISYFDALGAPSPLTTFWSLAIEEQFYLIWPPVLLLLLTLKFDKKFIMGLVGAVACTSAVLMFVLFDPAGDPSRVYYGTDTRCFSLLIGALLAFVWPVKGLGFKQDVQLSETNRIKLNVAGIVSFCGLVLLLTFTNGFSPFLYRGGMILISILTAVLIANIVHPCSILTPIFSNPVCSWIGTRSYGIYLWHYPILLLLIPRNIADNAPVWLLIVFLAVTFIVSELSYRFVENPIRKGAIGRIWKSIFYPEETTCGSSRARARSRQHARTRAGSTYAYASGGVGGVYASGLAFAASPMQRIKSFFLNHAIPSVATALVILVALGGIIFVPATSGVSTADTLKQLSEQSQEATPAAQAPPAETPEYKPYSVLLIGDSVSLMANDSFMEAFPGGHLDSAVSRYVSEVPGLYDYYDGYKLVGDVVVFAVGTNGPMSDSDFDNIMEKVGKDKRAFFVNTKSPRDWVSSCNASIASGCNRYDNAYLIDWYSYSINKSDLFDGDGTHLKYDMAPQYTQLIVDSITANGGLPEEPTADEIEERNEKLSGA